MTKKKPESSDINIDRELTKLRWKTRFRRITAWVKNPFQRTPGTRRLTLTRLLSLRALTVCLLSIAIVGQLGLAPIPGMPVDGNPASGVTSDAQDLVDYETTETRGDAATNDQAQDAPETVDEEDDGSSGVFDRDELDRREIEAATHQAINERRQEHGLNNLSADPELRAVARDHSRDMAENDYFAHTSPSGETMSDRYSQHDYSCRVRVNATHSMSGSENIAYTYAYTGVQGPNGESLHHTSEDEIAAGLVNQWMNSTGHRENILRPYWENEAIGVAITEENGERKIIATQNFC